MFLAAMRRMTQIALPKQIRLMSNGKGTGGKVGGSGGGAAPDAEGNVDKIKAVREEEFFHKQRGEQLKKLKTKKESPKQKNEQKKK